jgi:translation initiation factor 3 subunit I
MHVSRARTLRALPACLPSRARARTTPAAPAAPPPPSPQFPILLKGHERSITCVKYNREGDLLFTASKDKRPTVWFASNGERLGTFDGHAGAVFSLDVTADSRFLLTGSADQTARVWEVEGGREVASRAHPGTVQAVVWAAGARAFACASDPFATKPAMLTVWDFDPAAPSAPAGAPRLTYVDAEAPRLRFCAVDWSDGNRSLVLATESGDIRILDAGSGAVRRRVNAHARAVTSLAWHPSHALVLTTSADETAKLWDAERWECLQTFVSNTPLNAGALSPLKEHVFVGGGQEARDVTTTSAGAGRFETRIFHAVFGEELGRVSGHFGPINTMAIHPSGRSFVTGAEDGYIRVHHLDEVWAEYEKLGGDAALDAPEVVAALAEGLDRVVDAEHAKARAEAAAAEEAAAAAAAAGAGARRGRGPRAE